MPDVGALIEPHWFIFSSIGFFILAAIFFYYSGSHEKGGLVLLFIVIFTWGAVSHAYNQYGRIKKLMPVIGLNKSRI